jgi:hypothetical protein
MATIRNTGSVAVALGHRVLADPKPDARLSARRRWPQSPRISDAYGSITVEGGEPSLAVP